MVDIEKIIIVTQKTFLDELIEKYNTKEQAKFYIEYSGGSFDEYLTQHNNYYSSLRDLKLQLPLNLRYQVIEKGFLPNFIFGPNDLIIVLGRDGLVINTTKYLDEQPILGVNPDPSHIDGVLLLFKVEEIQETIKKIEENDVVIGEITLIQATLNDGQKIIGVNDIFVGHRSHKSARYNIEFEGHNEYQSSSGIIISSGIGSTGWMSSIIANSLRISHELGFSIDLDQTYNFSWNEDKLLFAVREAWGSNSTQNSLVFGSLRGGVGLTIRSHMTEGGVIFSDGMESDYLNFNSGKSVKIEICDKKALYYRK